MTAPEIVPFLLRVVSDDSKASQSFDELLQLNMTTAAQHLSEFLSVFLSKDVAVRDAKAEGLAEGQAKKLAEIISNCKSKGVAKDTVFLMSGILDKDEFDKVWGT